MLQEQEEKLCRREKKTVQRLILYVNEAYVKLVETVLDQAEKKRSKHCGVSLGKKKSR